MTLEDRAGGPGRRPDWELLKRLACPVCHGRLEWAIDTIDCAGCGRIFSIIEGIPVFTEPGTDNLAVDHHKRGQVAHFDGVFAEFEIDRPHHTTHLYQYLIDEKLRRGIRRIAALLPGATAVAVCGGSGMDAEYLARAGARVIVSDISLGAAFRVRERARRYDLDLLPIVADAEQLPFVDGGVEVALVHDGLHHLRDPRLGIAEMARVANMAVSITEPAQAAATRVAVWLGIAFDREEAGNRVERLSRQKVVNDLVSAGFRVVSAERYAMYYRHHPGRISRLMSWSPTLWGIRVMLWLFNGALGRIGNKLAVQAVRQVQAGELNPPSSSEEATETVLEIDEVRSARQR